MNSPLLQSSLPFPVRRGKVRDVYDLGEQLLIVATDRISAYDCVMPNGIPAKGKILTALSLFWFEKFAGKFENHLITADVAEYPPSLSAIPGSDRGAIDAREEGSRWFRLNGVLKVGVSGGVGGEGISGKSRTVCGTRCREGLRQCERLPKAIFTPATEGGMRGMT